MQTETGEITPLTPAEFERINSAPDEHARLRAEMQLLIDKGGVVIPDAERDAVGAMNRHDRRRWARQRAKALQRQVRERARAAARSG